MVTPLSLSHHYPAPAHAPDLSRRGGQERPEPGRRPAEKIPPPLDLESARRMEQRLAQRAARRLAQEGQGLQARRAVSAYEQLAVNEERDRIRGMLGIDLFA